MKKAHVTNAGILADVRAHKKEICADAITVQEIAAEMCSGTSTARSFAQERVKRGLWRQVWKRIGRNLAPAYVRAS